MFCIKCGNKVAEGSKFCISCGQEVEKKTVAINNIPKEKPLWKKVLTTILSVLVFLTVYGVARYSVQSGVSSLLTTGDKGLSTEQILVETSNEINKQLPMMVDKATQLSSTVAQGKDLVYMYKLIGSYESVSQQDLDSSLKEGIVNGACANLETKKMLNMGIRLVYNYSDNNGRYIGKIPVSLSSCK